MKQLLVLLILLTGVHLDAAGQTFNERFNDLYSKKDTAGEEALLSQWESNKPNDPELYVSYYNFYVQKSKKEMVGLDKQQKDEQSFSLKDSTGKVAGYMNFVVVYDDSILVKGFTYIDRGISMFPNRLDMRFGKIYILGQIKNYPGFTDEIVTTIDYSSRNKNAWLWKDNKPKKDPKAFMLDEIQEYVLQLYNTNDDSLLDNMKRIAEEVLRYYPDHVESLSDLSIVYMINKDYDKGLECLLKAEKLAPTDYIVLNNIAMAYRGKGDVANAIKYYEKVLKYGDEDVKASTRETIDELKKQK